MTEWQEAAELAALRDERPAFAISPEIVRGRRRYVARRLDRQEGVHTVVTGSLAELRAALSEADAGGVERRRTAR